MKNNSLNLEKNYMEYSMHTNERLAKYILQLIHFLSCVIKTLLVIYLFIKK